MRHAGIPFEERLILLFDENWRESVANVSLSGCVPLLLHGERTKWETLAILEYVNELFADAGLWPSDRGARAQARAVAGEMHAGFSALRNHMPMNLRRGDLKGKCRGPGATRTSRASVKSGGIARHAGARTASSCTVPSARPMPCSHGW